MTYETALAAVPATTVNSGASASGMRWQSSTPAASTMRMPAP